MGLMENTAFNFLADIRKALLAQPARDEHLYKLLATQHERDEVLYREVAKQTALLTEIRDLLAGQAR